MTASSQQHMASSIFPFFSCIMLTWLSFDILPPPSYVVHFAKCLPWGKYFRVTTYGESLCRSVGYLVDGCPPDMELQEADIQTPVLRRRPVQSAFNNAA